MNPHCHESTEAVSRRQFIVNSYLAVSAVVLNNRPLVSAEAVNRPARKLRAAIICHTGKEDYGHGMDLVFNERENIEVVAVAEPRWTNQPRAMARQHLKLAPTFLAHNGLTGAGITIIHTLLLLHQVHRSKEAGPSLSTTYAT